MNIRSLLCSLLCILMVSAIAQPDRWQQRVEYVMDIDFNVENHQFSGVQTLTYFNNSPDELDKVFYHLYFNAFQPGSMMDVRSRSLPDPDGRVRDRILHLEPEEQGYHRILSLTQDGEKVKWHIEGTILEVKLANVIKPGSKSVFKMEFESQVPVQVRRSGRNNKEGIDYSMAQWYPKISEYDYQGWHANPYVGREFYGVWGDFDVRISIDRNYMVAASGYLQNANKIGYGYEDEGTIVPIPKSKKITWHFKAPNVHDFVWAADRDYTHDRFETKDGVTLHFFYQKNDKTEESWSQLPEYTDKAMTYINEHYGKYPYKQYSVIQGGDGGMEYPMATLITGNRKLRSLVGVTVHEILHSWFQMILGTNESLYSWMDEGFTSFADSEVMKELFDPETDRDPYAGTYVGYIQFTKTGKEEALSIHADHYMTNSAYGLNAYTKGCIFLNQLKYIIGEEAFRKTMLDYFETWKFKHPNPNDFIRIAELASGLELDWYKEYWVNTTHTIDYGVQSVISERNKITTIVLTNYDRMPMPVEVKVIEKNGNESRYYIPLRIMRGEKKFKNNEMTVSADWPWTHSEYTLTIPVKYKNIQSIIIDPENMTADIYRENNSWIKGEEN